MKYYFDLDNTLIDTREIRMYKRNVEGRKWIADDAAKFSTSVVNPGLINIIRTLGSNAGVITNSPLDYAHALLEKHGFPDIEIFASADKPCCDRRVLDKLVRPCMYIGDEPLDILFAHENQIPSIAYVEKSFFPSSKIDKALPSATAKNIAELEKLLSEDLLDEPRNVRDFIPLTSAPGEHISVHSVQEYYTPENKQKFKDSSSGDILTYKRAKDCTWEEIHSWHRDSFVYKKDGQRHTACGVSYKTIINKFSQKLKQKIDSLVSDGTLSGSIKMIAVPNSLPEFAYLCDINYRVACNFNQEEKGRNLYRIRPVKDAHSRGVRSANKHIGTLAVHSRPSLDLNVDNIILFDDITTSGTQIDCAAALLRKIGYQNNIVGLVLGKTADTNFNPFADEI